MEAIQALQEKVEEIQADGYEMLQSDESLFSVDAYV